MFDHHDITRNEFMLHGPLGHHGYDWWWHSFTAQDVQTGAEKPFFIEFFICNPALGEEEPVLGQLPANQAEGKRPSYLMVKAGCWSAERFCLMGESIRFPLRQATDMRTRTGDGISPVPESGLPPAA